MITHICCRVTGLLSALVFRVVMLGATGVWLSLSAANAPAQTTRPYQMSIIATTEGSDIVDIPIFHYTHRQPAGYSIVWLPYEDKDPDPSEINIDWTRIVAAYVDEPYNDIFEPIGWRSCNASVDPVKGRIERLRAIADFVRGAAPSARFWINFSEKDVELIKAGCALNQDYIDVISFDQYGVGFSALRADYDYLYNSARAMPTRQHQQLALVPGTFTGGWHNQNGTDGAARLVGFFDYAAYMNQYCGSQQGPIVAPKLGRMGRTGIYDECPVWLVAGWFGGRDSFSEKGYVYYPIDFDRPDSRLVRAKWQERFAVPRLDPTRVRQAIKAAPLLFND